MCLSQKRTQKPGRLRKIWDHGDEGRIFKASFSENPGITIGKQEELAGYSSKRLIREINEQEYQISLKPVVVKTTFEKHKRRDHGGDSSFRDNRSCVGTEIWSFGYG